MFVLRLGGGRVDGFLKIEKNETTNYLKPVVTEYLYIPEEVESVGVAGG